MYRLFGLRHERTLNGGDCHRLTAGGKFHLLAQATQLSWHVDERTELYTSPTNRALGTARMLAKWLAIPSAIEMPALRAMDVYLPITMELCKELRPRVPWYGRDIPQDLNICETRNQMLGRYYGFLDNIVMRALLKQLPPTTLFTSHDELMQHLLREVFRLDKLGQPGLEFGECFEVLLVPNRDRGLVYYHLTFRGMTTTLKFSIDHLPSDHFLKPQGDPGSDV